MLKQESLLAMYGYCLLLKVDTFPITVMGDNPMGLGIPQVPTF